MEASKALLRATALLENSTATEHATSSFRPDPAASTDEDELVLLLTRIRRRLSHCFWGWPAISLLRKLHMRYVPHAKLMDEVFRETIGIEGYVDHFIYIECRGLRDANDDRYFRSKRNTGFQGPDPDRTA